LPFYPVIVLGLKVVFKYTRRITAMRVFSGIKTKEMAQKSTKTNHREIKAKYIVIAAFFIL